eukprot:287496-Rhodomonas_salina.4
MRRLGEVLTSSVVLHCEIKYSKTPVSVEIVPGLGLDLIDFGVFQTYECMMDYGKHMPGLRLVSSPYASAPPSPDQYSAWMYLLRHSSFCRSTTATLLRYARY